MRFSIITVCRNDLEGLKLTYNSVIKQTFPDFEWIVVDGNSSDGTREWLQSCNKKNIRWISESDNGIFDAMNKGILLARGEYLLFLNSFDEFAGINILEKVHNLICSAKKQPEFIYGDSIDITLEGNSMYRKSKHFKTLWRGMFTQHQSMFFRNNKNIFFQNEYRITADYAYIGHYLKDLTSTDVKYINTAVCKFKLGGINESSRFRALNEDFLIRKNELGIGIFMCTLLYILHFLHTLQKRMLPNTARALRYKYKQNIPADNGGKKSKNLY